MGQYPPAPLSTPDNGAGGYCPGSDKIMAASRSISRYTASITRFVFGGFVPNLAKPVNRIIFLVCVLVTGALAGAFVWLFFFLMDKGISFLWSTVPAWLGALTADIFPILSQGSFGFIPYPLLVWCIGRHHYWFIYKEGKGPA